MPDYINDNLLVDVSWVKEHIKDANIVIIDCDAADAFNRGHIPGAVHLPTHQYVKSAKDKLFVMDPNEFSEMCSSMGIDNESLVIVYDNSQSLYATRLWWVFDYYGYSQVKVLNGGWKSWINEGEECSFERPNIQKNKTFIVSAVPNSSRYSDKDELMQVCSADNAIIWDVRSNGEYDGTETRGNKRNGHVPGAIHLEWFSLMDRETHKFKPLDEMKNMLVDAGIFLDKPIYSY